MKLEDLVQQLADGIQNTDRNTAYEVLEQIEKHKSFERGNKHKTKTLLLNMLGYRPPQRTASGSLQTITDTLFYLKAIGV